MKPPQIQNETSLDARRVSAIIRYVFRYLDLDGRGIMVKVKHTRNASYAGRFYPHARQQGGYVWDDARGDWRDIGPKVPDNITHLLVVRIANPAEFKYPRSNHVYDRKHGPEPWMLEDWQEALVSITAHEAEHLRQYRTSKKRGGRWGRFNETATEWTARRIWQAWRRDQKRG